MTAFILLTLLLIVYLFCVWVTVGNQTWYQLSYPEQMHVILAILFTVAWAIIVLTGTFWSTL